MLDGLNTMANKIAEGSILHRLVKWISVAPLMLQRKVDGGVIPVSVGETNRCMASSLFIGLVRPQVQDILDPLQLDVAPKGCSKPIVQVTRRFAKYLGDDRCRLVLQVDLIKAFNLVSLQSIMVILPHRFSDLYLCVYLCYDEVYPLILPVTYTSNSGSGVKKGDEVGKRRFSIVLEEPLTFLCKIIA